LASKCQQMSNWVCLRFQKAPCPMQTIEKHVMYTEPSFSAQKPGGFSLWLTLVHLGTSVDCQQLLSPLKFCRGILFNTQSCLLSHGANSKPGTTHYVFPSCTSSLSGRTLCICPWAAFPPQSASPSSSDPPSSCSTLSVRARCQASQQCRPHVGGARAVGTSGGGTGARELSWRNVRLRIIAVVVF
jgi:hypothetical protein